MAIKIDMLRCFAVVAESGNLADAADRLGRTPSAVSMMLKQFEEHLGAPLFESERKSRLTALGAFALDQATRELDHFSRTVTALEHFSRAEAGFVRVAAVPSVAEAILPEVVRDFLHDHPGVHIDIRDMDSAGVLRELDKERVDLGFASAAGVGAEIVREELFSDAFGVVCRPDHPLVRAARPIAWSDLESRFFIGNGICRHIADEQFQKIFSGSRLMVRNTTSLLAMVRAGIGITVLPRLAVDPAEDRLTFLTVADPTARRRIDVLRRRHLTPTPAAAQFEAAMRRAAGTVVQVPRSTLRGGPGGDW
ncbi:MAG: LysR family transcriptional regulator [Alphaproteobacteria bacterium]